MDDTVVAEVEIDPDELPKKRIRTPGSFEGDSPLDPPSARDRNDTEQRVIKRYKDAVRNRKTAIRAMCIECMGGSVAEVRRCTSLGCPLYVFRNGEDPFHSKTREKYAKLGIQQGVLEPGPDSEEEA